MKFTCDKCGLCCSHLKDFGPPYENLDRGDGVCKNFNEETKLCNIYEQRPILCRVEDGYKQFFSHIPYEEYVEKNLLGCQALKDKYL